MIPISYFDSVYASTLPHRAISVYMYLKNRCNKQNQCFPSIARISSDLGISRSTTKRALHDLRENGYLKIEKRYRRQGGRSSSLYTIL